MRDLMNNNMLQAFARNGLQILQWCMLVLLYEAEARGETLTQGVIRDRLDLPKSDHPPPSGASPSALVREILRSSREKYGHVKYLGNGTWQLTDEGRKFVEEQSSPKEPQE